jgi:hypothetical protein
VIFNDEIFIRSNWWKQLSLNAIDIIVGVRDLDEISEFVIHEIDYEYVPKPEFIDRRFFREGLWGQGTCHLHL